MKRNANYKLSLELTPEVAHILRGAFNEDNRPVNRDHVLNMAIDYTSGTEYYMPDLVSLLITIPKSANAGEWTTENFLHLLNEHRQHIDLANGGHTATLFADHRLSEVVNVLVYETDGAEDEAAIRRSCDKSRARGGSDKMHFSDSTPQGVYEATGVVITKPELGLVHKAVSTIMLGFSLTDTSSPTSQFSVAAKEETIKYAATAQSYLDKINAADISKKAAKELRSKGLMSIFIFLMQHDRLKGKAFNFLNAILEGNELMGSKKAAEQMYMWLLSNDPQTNPNTNSKKTSAQLQAFAYYWGEFYNKGSSSISSLVLAKNWKFVTKGAKVSFAGLYPFETEKHACYEEHKAAKKEVRAVSKFAQQQRLSQEAAGTLTKLEQLAAKFNNKVS